MLPSASSSAVRIFPNKLHAAIAKQSREAFVPAWGSLRLLLVRLDGHERKFAEMLEQTSASTLEDIADMFDYGESDRTRTIQVDVDEVQSARVRRFDAAALRARLKAHPYFVSVMLKRKNAPNPYMTKICVGRSRTNDIVLGHASVSKYHAWFDCDDECAYWIGNAGGKNPTLVNGRVVGREPIEISPGGDIRIGHVACTLCIGDMLWDALHLPS